MPSIRLSSTNALRVHVCVASILQAAVMHGLRSVLEDLRRHATAHKIPWRWKKNQGVEGEGWYKGETTANVNAQVLNPMGGVLATFHAYAPLRASARSSMTPDCVRAASAPACHSAQAGSAGDSGESEERKKEIISCQWRLWRRSPHSGPPLLRWGAHVCARAGLLWPPA